MDNTDSRRLTLWRTCRILANTIRLRIFRLLVRQGRSTVTGVSKRLSLPITVASQYLRALEARGLLRVRRVRRWVEYEAGSVHPSGATQELVNSLRSRFSGADPQAVHAVFRLATAFTHPRRVQVYERLSQRAHRLGELKRGTGISARALLRHLDKLMRRGFVQQHGNWRGKYRAIRHRDAIGRALARLAVHGP